MQKITLPSKLSYTLDEDNEYKAVLTIEPLFPGYGLTVGNALRRVLLSSLPGAAITAYRIAGVSHEFSTIEFVKEDAIEIMLNLKQIRLKSTSKEPAIIKLSVKGEKTVTAGDIEKHADVEVVNPEQVIMTLTNKDAAVDMEFTVEQGRGFVTVEQRDNERTEIGWIAIDAIYTPITNINFKIQAARVGQITNYDKLEMVIHTDKTIKPEEAIQRSAKILVDHFSALMEGLVLDEGGEDTRQLEAEERGEVEEETSAESTNEASENVEEGESTEATDAMSTPIEELELSTRTVNALYNNDIKTVNDVIKLTEDEVADLQGLGGKAVDEIRKALGKLGADFAASESND
ncbi:DNA-directed RNA polymerase subunit alpha [Patescibacteria group bacterium]